MNKKLNKKLKVKIQNKFKRQQHIVKELIDEVKGVGVHAYNDSDEGCIQFRFFTARDVEYGGLQIPVEYSEFIEMDDKYFTHFVKTSIKVVKLAEAYGISYEEMMNSLFEQSLNILIENEVNETVKGFSKYI